MSFPLLLLKGSAAVSLTLMSALLLSACGSEPTGHQGTLETEQVAQPLALYDMRSSSNFVTYGDVITRLWYVSFDGGTSWQEVDGLYSGRVGQVTRKELVAPGVMYFYGSEMGGGILHMEEKRVEKISALSNIPPDRLEVRYDHATKTVYGFRQYGEVERYRNGAWERVAVPTTAMTDVAVNGEGIFVILPSTMYRSLDDGASFEEIHGIGGHELTRLPDGRLVLDDEILTAQGEPTGRKINYPVEHRWSARKLSFCDDGSWVHGGYQSRDDGETWESVFEGDDPHGAWGATEFARCEGGRWYFYVSVGNDGPGTRGYLATAEAPNAPMRWVQSNIDARPEGLPGLYNPVQLGSNHYGIWGMPAWWDPDAKVWRPEFMTGKVHRLRSGRLVQTLAGMHRISEDGGRTWEIVEPFQGYPMIHTVFEYPDGRWVAGHFFTEELPGGGTQITATHYVSADEGRIWTQAYQGVMFTSRTGETQGEAHVLLGVTRDGKLISSMGHSEDEGKSWKTYAFDDDVQETVIAGSLSGLVVTRRWDVTNKARLGVRSDLGRGRLREYDLGDASGLLDSLQFELLAVDDDDRLVFYHDGLRRSRSKL